MFNPSMSSRVFTPSLDCSKPRLAEAAIASHWDRPTVLSTKLSNELCRSCVTVRSFVQVLLEIFVRKIPLKFVKTTSKRSCFLVFSHMWWKRLKETSWFLKVQKASFWNDYFGRSEKKLLLSKNNKKCL